MAQPADADKPHSGNWIVIAEQPDEISAEILMHYLRRVAIPARLAAGDTMSFLGPSVLATRILVPEEWEQEALVALERRDDHNDILPPGVVL